MNLKLVSTKLILDELTKRFDHMIFSGVTFRTNRIGATRKVFSGEMYTCAGLANNLIHFLMNEIEKCSYGGEE